MEAQDTYFSAPQILDCGGKRLDLSRPAVMGILNITPDSFYAGSRMDSAEAALAAARQMLADGAAILDVGAASTRPGSVAPSETEEWQRLQPVLQLLHAELPEAIISVDTFRATVARKAVAAGATIINDVLAGAGDPDMFAFAGECGLPYVLMHSQGTPETMQLNPQYSNVTHEVGQFFTEKIAALRKAGATQIILDPGFGFGKTMEHNFQLLRELDFFTRMPYPVLAGLSRKSMLNRLLHITAAEALNATTAANMIALQKGALLLRVHDVKEAVQAVRVFEKANEKSS